MRRAVAVAVAVSLGGTMVLASVLDAGADIDRSSRGSVGGAYRGVLAPAIKTSTEWDGSSAKCDAGDTSSDSKQATLDAVNFMRKMAGLSPVHISPSYTVKAQKAALVFRANSTNGKLYLTHSISTSAKCYSKDAATGAANSNIAVSTDTRAAGANAVLAYMADEGTGNEAVGHRRWLLDPRLAWIGVGSTVSSSAIYVTGIKATHYDNPSFVTWPTSGYFPSQLEPAGRWSISGATGHDYDFSKATVTVTNGDGTKLAVKKFAQHDGYANDTLSFQVAGVTKPTSNDLKLYTVTMSGAKKDGKAWPTLTYTIKMFDPTKG